MQTPSMRTPSGTSSALLRTRRTSTRRRGRGSFEPRAAALRYTFKTERVHLLTDFKFGFHKDKHAIATSGAAVACSTVLHNPAAVACTTPDDVMPALNRRRSRWKQKTHVTLLIYVFILVVGSAVWLKLALNGDHTGAKLRRPAWAAGGRGDERASNIKLRLEPRWGSCSFADASVGAQYCGTEQAAIPVTAHLTNPGQIVDNVEGLFLMLRASSDFRTWWGATANGLMLPRDHFSFVNATITDVTRDKLTDAFKAAEVRAATVVNPTVQRPEPGRVLIGDLTAPLLNQNFGAPSP